MKIIDLSYTIKDCMPVYTGDENVSLKQIKTLESDFYNAFNFNTGLHVGTHVDIPKHLSDDNRFISDFPIDCFTGNGVILDVRNQNLITFKHEYENMIFKGAVVLFYSGYADMYTETKKYYASYPDIADELCSFLISKGIKLLGIDFPSPDHPPFTIHKKLLSAEIPIAENLTNLKMLLGVKSFKFFAVPLKLEAEASLVRGYALVDTEDM